MNSYAENTDEPGDYSFNIYIQPALHLTNLLPIDVECSIDVCLRLILDFK